MILFKKFELVCLLLPIAIASLFDLFYPKTEVWLHLLQGERFLIVSKQGRPQGFAGCKTYKSHSLSKSEPIWFSWGGFPFMVVAAGEPASSWGEQTKTKSTNMLVYKTLD